MSEPTAIDLLQAIHELGQRMDARFSKLEADVAEIKGRIIGVEARLDDQSRTLAALIPSKIATVGGR